MIPRKYDTFNRITSIERINKIKKNICSKRKQRLSHLKQLRGSLMM